MYSLPSSQYEQVDALASPSTTAASTHESLEALSRAALLSHASPASVQQQQHNDPVVLSKKPTQQLVPMTTTTLNGRTSPGSVKDEDDTNDTSATLTTTTTTGPTKQHKKRGRKRIEPDAAAVETNDALDADAKRKIQNRAAQRAFRERKERRVIELEDKVVKQEAELAQCRDIIRQLQQENEALRMGRVPSPGRPWTLPTTESPSDVKPALVTSPHDRPVPSSSSSSFQTILNKDVSPRPVASTTTPNPSSLSRPITDTEPQPYDLHDGSGPVKGNGDVDDGASPASMTTTKPSLYDGNAAAFDFDAPFDFSESMALPSLFASLLDDLALPPSNNVDATSAAPSLSRPNGTDGIGPGDDTVMSGVATERGGGGRETENRVPGGGGGGGGDGDGDDDDDPPPLPLGRIPCDKPECDFTAVSCALPIPWRPPNAPDGSDDKHLWIAQKCWAKLVSHPLFDKCDSDELCQELRDRTRCSDDGRLVCHKDDVCAIFRSIPHKAELRQMTHMGE
ncbi:hypothetical protein JCM3766R1_006585 [Sporobolomyces carnicolor]